MRIVGNKLIARRNRGDTITFRLEYENGDPFVIASGWDNPHFVMTIASSRYSQEQRYIKSWWVNLDDRRKFYNTEILLSIEADEYYKPGLPPSNFVGVNSQVVKTIVNGVSYYWYAGLPENSETHEWLEYEPLQISIPFTVQDASEWIEQNYRWDCSIMAGTLTNEGQGKPPLKDFIVVKSLVEDAEMEVSSDSMGGLK